MAEKWRAERWGGICGGADAVNATSSASYPENDYCKDR